jgi:hypothetical protein
LNRPRFHLIALVFAGAALAFAQTGTPPATQTPPQPVSPSVQGEKPSSTPPPTAGAPQAAQQPEPQVPETAPVITIDGLCAVSTNGAAKGSASGNVKGSGTGAVKSLARTGTATGAASSRSTSSASSTGDCKTQITRAEFEKLVRAVAPTAPPQYRRQIATKYVQILTAANEGVKLGVDKDPDFAEKLELTRLQLIGQDAERKLQTQASSVSDADLKAYYDQNPPAFEEITLTRLFVPHGPADAKQTDAATDPKAIAENARQQLMIGGDPEKIEKSTYEQLKNTSQPPSTKFGARRRNSLPAAQEQKLFAMKDGEVSEVISDPTGYAIYRVDEKRQLPFDKVKDEVKQTIARQRMADVSQKILGASKAEYNDAYFGPEVTNPPRMGPPGVPQGSRPPSPAPGTVPPAGEPNRSQSSPPSTPK